MTKKIDIRKFDKKLLEQAAENKYPNNYVSGAIFTKTGVTFQNGGCNAWCKAVFNSATYLPMIYLQYRSYKEEVSQDLIRWLLTDKSSIFRPIIEKLGAAGFKIDYDKDKLIRGFFISDLTINNKVLFNFMKSVRCTSEHSHRLKFWKKYKMEKGYHPGLVYMLMFNFDPAGNYNASGHSPLEENTITNGLNLFGFYNSSKYNNWNFSEEVVKNQSFQTTRENVITWGGKFNPSRDILKNNQKKVATMFYKKYFEKPGKGLSVDDLTQFFKDASSERTFTEKYKEFI